MKNAHFTPIFSLPPNKQQLAGYNIRKVRATETDLICSQGFLKLQMNWEHRKIHQQPKICIKYKAAAIFPPLPPRVIKRL